MNKICSSGSIAGLTKLINSFFYSVNYHIKDMQLYNKETMFYKIEIKKEGKRFIAYFKN